MMKKRINFFSALVLGWILLTTNVQAATEKLAYVDLSRIFSEYNKTKDYDKVLGDKEDTYTKERDKRIEEIKQFQDKLNLLSAKEKEAKKQELETKIENLKKFQLQQETDLRKEQNEKMKDILKDIEETVKEYAEKEGYVLVFNDRVLVYQAKNLDITDKIIQILNSKYKK